MAESMSAAHVGAPGEDVPLKLAFTAYRVMCMYRDVASTVCRDAWAAVRTPADVARLVRDMHPWERDVSRWVLVPRTALSQFALQYLQHLTCLRDLDISSMYCSDKFVALWEVAAPRLTRLQRLTLGCGAYNTVRLCATFQHLPSLTHLYMDDVWVTLEGIKLPPALRILSARLVTSAPPERPGLLAFNRREDEAAVRLIQDACRAADQLSKPPSPLRRLCGQIAAVSRLELTWPLHRTLLIEDVLDLLKETPYARSVVTANVPDLGPLGVAVLCARLPHVPMLRSLNLAYCNAGPDGARALAAALPAVPGLRTLNCNGNNIGPDGARALADALVVVSGLHDLQLSRNGIGADGMAAVASKLKHVPCLRELHVAQNGIGPEGMLHLCTALVDAAELQFLEVSNNDIGPSGGVAFAGILKHIPLLRELYIGSNAIGYEGVAAITSNVGYTLARMSIDTNGLTYDERARIRSSMDLEQFEYGAYLEL